MNEINNTSPGGTMTIEEFAEKAIKVYKKHKLDVDGEYNDRGCTKPCCYPNLWNVEKASKKMEKLVKGFRTKDCCFYFVFYPGDYPSIKEIAHRLKIDACDHVYVYDGIPSNTSQGNLALYKCIDCGAVEYRNLE